MAGSEEEAQGNPVLSADPECGRDGDGSGDRNCAFPPADSLLPEIFSGLFLLSPDAGNQRVEQPGSSPENNAPEILGDAVNGPRDALDAWSVGSALGVLSAGGDPGRLAEVLQKAGYFPADLPPDAAVKSAAGDFGQILQSLFALLWPAKTAALPPGQEKTGRTGDLGVSFAPVGVQIKPAEELNQFNNLLKVFFFRQQGATGLSNPEGNIETVNSLLVSGLKEASAAAGAAELQTKGAGIPDSVAALLRQAQAALLALREQTGPENFQGSAVPEGSGEGSGAVKTGPEPTAGQQVRLPAKIVQQEGFPAALQSSSGGKQQISPFASVNRPVLPESLFPGEKGLSAGTAGKNPVLLILNYGNGAAGAVHFGGGQGSVAPSLIPALVSQALQQAAGRSFAGETRLRLKLEPEHLGELVIRLVYRAGEVSAYFQTSSAQVREAIENSLPQLREALAGQNLHLQNASVSVGQQESEFLLRENYEQAGYNYPRQSGGPGQETDLPGPGPETGPLPGYGSVNLFI